MKTKEIYLVVAASVLVVAGWATWRFVAAPPVVDPPAATSLPAQKTTPSTQKATSDTSPRTSRPIVSEVIETPEMKRARFSAEMSRIQASSAARKADFALLKTDPKAYRNALRDRHKPEDMAFLKSLGLSDELRDKVYQMLRAKAELYSDHQEKIMEALRRGEIDTAYGRERLQMNAHPVSPWLRESATYGREVLQMNADLEAAVGTENYGKIKYYEATLLERGETARFQRYLQSRSLPLTEQQEAAVVEAMRQARVGGGKPNLSLISSGFSMEDKLAYIDTVKQSVAPVLNANDLAHLGQYLKDVAESDLKSEALNEKIQTKIREIQKTIEDKKRNLPNPPAPPR